MFFRLPQEMEHQESESDNVQLKNAIAPAEAAGAEKFVEMLRRDSSDLTWRVSFKTMRKARVGDARIPCGFPQLWSFFLDARSLRVFQWAFRKYKELYCSEDGWHRWVAMPNSVGEWHAQKLRACIWSLCENAQFGRIRDSTKKTYTVSKTQNEIISWTFSVGFWNEVELCAAPTKIRARRMWNLLQVGVRIVSFVNYLSTAVKERNKKRMRNLSPCHSIASNDRYISETALFGDSDSDEPKRVCKRVGKRALQDEFRL